MYAAAGGASLASRQARMRQKQQKKNQQLQAKLHPPKAPGLVEHATPTRQSRQFHQLPTTYLRAPQAHGRKLSASYTAQSKLLLPIEEGDTQSVLHMRMHSHAHIHPMQHSHVHGQITHQQQQQQTTTTPQQHHAIQGSYYQHFAAAAAAHGRVSPKLTHRHSGSSSGASFYQTPANLPKSATATLPLVSQMEATPPATPSGAAVAVRPDTAAASSDDVEQTTAMCIPQHDSIIVTPATPMASPGHVIKLRDTDETPAVAAERQPLTAAEADEEEGGDVDSPMQTSHPPLERKCSVYRMRRSDADEYAESGSVRRQLRELQFNSQQQYEPLIIDEPQLMFKGLPNGRKWQPCAYCEEGICVCEHIECAQGRAAWLERGRRCSVQEREQAAAAAACHRRWVKRNRIQDASLGGSSDDEDFLGVLRGPSTFANAFLYVGLGTVALGLVIAFVGTGEKGFKTVELRLIGPSLIVIGLVCCILRILFCICPSHCIASSKKARKKNGNKVDADHTTSLLRGESKRVSIARGPQARYPMTHKRGNSRMLNDGMEALRQLATTSLFMQNEQKPSMNRVVPIIKEPENPIEAPLEMKKLDTELSVYEIANDATLNEDASNARNETTTRSKSAQAKSNESKATRDTAKTTAVKLKSPPAAKATEAAATAGESRTDRFEEAKTKTKTKTAAEVEEQAIPARQPIAKEKSDSLSSSSPVKEAIDGELQMETSLSAQPTASKEPELEIELSTATTKSATTQPPPTSSASTGAISRLPSSLSTPAAAAIATTTTAITTTSYSLYDMPPSTPHTYASTIRSEPPHIRGPLGMPLSQLTASTSAYAMPATNAAAATAPATTTTISLLPLPAPTLSTTASIPGQVIETGEAPAKNPLAARLSSPKGFTFATPSRFSVGATSGGIGGGVTHSKLTSQLPAHFKTSASFQLANAKPTTMSLASISGQSSSSAASSQIATTTTATIAAAAATATGTATTLAPPPAPTHQSSKLNPELLLSPAKLGQ